VRQQRQDSAWKYTHDQHGYPASTDLHFFPLAAFTGQDSPVEINFLIAAE
jgi:hypothetical protein